MKTMNLRTAKKFNNAYHAEQDTLECIIALKALIAGTADEITLADGWKKTLTRAYYHLDDFAAEIENLPETDWKKQVKGLEEKWTEYKDELKALEAAN